MRAAVMGTGSWGTAFAKVLADAGTSTTLWARRQELADQIRSTKVNDDYLPGLVLPDSLDATHDPAEALDGADLVVLAVPSQTLRGNLVDWAPSVPRGATLLSLMKGVELGTSKRMSQVVAEVAGVADEQVAVLSGPNLAREIAAGQPAAAVVACSDKTGATDVQKACTTTYFKAYINTDVVGSELGGACKNVIALACGMAEGLGLGENTKATLMTRGLAETARLGVALGAQPMTFLGLAGLGDLVATCTSPLSRNRTYGELLGRGQTREQIAAASHQVAEGVKSCESILALAQQHGVDMPITEAVVEVCHSGRTVRWAMEDLLGREVAEEF